MGFSLNRVGLLFVLCIAILACAGCTKAEPEDAPSGIAPSVFVSFPDGGQMYKGGDTVTITWSASDDKNLPSNPIRLEYSEYGTFKVIASSVANTGGYVWTVPADVDSSNVRIKVTVTDANDNIKSALSEIFTVDNTNPLLSVSDPDPTTTLNPGETVTLSWFSFDVNMSDTPFTLEYEYPTSTWNPITTPLGRSVTSFDWIVPGIDTAQQTISVRVTSTDAAGNTTTASPTGANPDITINGDSTPPQIIGIYYGVKDAFSNYTPLDGASDVGKAECLKIIFNESMDRVLTNAALSFKLGLTDKPFSKIWTSTNRTDDTVILVPTLLMEDYVADSYTVEVATTAEDKAGNTLVDANRTATFTTYPDTQGPQLSGVAGYFRSTNGPEPLDSGTIPSNPIYGVEIDFDESIGSVDEARVQVLMLEMVDDNDMQITIAGSTVTLLFDLDDDGFYGESPDDELPGGWGFTLSIEVTDTSPDSNQERHDLFFSTAAPAAGDKPEIMAMIPKNGAKSYPANNPLYLVISEPVNPATILSGIEITNGGTPLTLADYELWGGNTLWLFVDGGLPGNSTLTVGVNSTLEDLGGNTAADGGTTYSLSTGPADTIPPGVFSCTIGTGDDAIDTDPYILINLNELVQQDTITNNTVYVKDAVTGEPFRCFDLHYNIQEEGQGLQMFYDWRLGSSLGYNKAYILCIDGVEDLAGNVADIEIPFTTHDSASSDSAPGITRVSLNPTVAPETLIIGGRSTDIVTGLNFYVEVMNPDSDSLSVTVSYDDTVAPFQLTGGPSSFWYGSEGDEKIYDNGDGWDPMDLDEGAQDPKLMYDNTEGDDDWDEGEDIWYDVNGDGFYSTGDTKVYDNGDGWGPVIDTTPGSNVNLYFHDDIDDDTFDIGVDDLWNDNDGDVSGSYEMLETIPAGPGVFTVTVDDGTNTVTYDMTYFIPGELPRQESPIYAEVVDQPNPVNLTWSLPNGGAGYPNSAIMALVGQNIFDGAPATPPIMGSGEESGVTIYPDINLEPNWHMWVLWMFTPGYDCMTQAMNFSFSLRDVFVYNGGGPTVSGTISHDGATPGLEEGNIIVGLYLDPGLLDGPPITATILDGPGPYTLHNCPSDSGIYHVVVLRDANGDMESMDEEAAGVSSTFTLDGSSPTGIDVVISEGFDVTP